MSAYRKTDVALLFVFFILGLFFGFVFFVIAFAIMNSGHGFAMIQFNNHFPANAFYRIGIWFLFGIFTSFSLWVVFGWLIYFLKKATADKGKAKELENSCRFACYAWLAFALLAVLIIAFGLLHGPHSYSISIEN